MSADQVDPTRRSATIAIRGHGAVEVVPDVVSITLGVDVFDTTLRAAQSAASGQMAAIIAALKATGIADRDLQTTRYDVRVRNEYDEHGRILPGVLGFDVTNHLHATIRDPGRLGEVLDAVVAAGANAIDGIAFTVDDVAEAESRARDLAVKDGLRKAEELAKAAGLDLGRLVSMSEGSDRGFQPVYEARRFQLAEAASVPIETGSSTVAVDVHLVFEIDASRARHERFG
jgi:uncharacterized protein